jgi:DNA modification methylase
MTWHPDMPDEYKNAIVTGDARLLAERIPDESVDLIFTDPVYDRIDDYRWLAETAARVLKVGGDILTYAWNELLPEVLSAMVQVGIFYRCTIAHYHPGRVRPKFICAGFNLWTPLVWLSTKNDKRLKWRDAFQTMPEGLRRRSNHHRWAKPSRGIAQGIVALTSLDSTVVDFFTGGGTVPAASKMLGRNYIAFEIDPTTAEAARQRVANTQPPLFVVEPEQAEMVLEGEQ